MKRYLSLDLLRGLTIFGMVFSAIIPFGGVLPRWMYHIQNPPPTHMFDPSVSGISWVDLVFPIFIFCMGAAIPLAGRKRLEKGSSVYIKEVLERFLMLWLFSYLYVLLNFDSAEGWSAQFATILGFISFFPLFMVIGNNGPKWVAALVPYKRWIRISGMILIAAMILVGHLRFGEEISLSRSGIIIFLLAFLYLFGSLAWFLTRDNHKWRLAAFILVLILCAVTMPFDIQPKLYAVKSIRWFFNMEYFYFLLILIPATYIGDLLQKKISSSQGYNPLEKGKRIGLLFLLFLGLIVWEMVALYNGFLLLNFIVSLIVAVVIWFSIEKNLPEYTTQARLSMILLISGLVSLFIEGSITKCPCTVSYCLVTTSLSILLLMLMDYVSAHADKGFVSFFTRIFSGAGSNPLMSYITFGNFLMPLFKLTGLIVIYQAAYPQGYPWIGVARAFMVVLLTMSMVAFMSERKIFWRA